MRYFLGEDEDGEHEPGPDLFGVWVTVSGGVTGYREAWLRRDGDVRLFATLGEAEQACTGLRDGDVLLGGTTPSGRPIALRTFEARAYTPRTR